MVPNDSPKIGIYFSHYECLGHVSRVMAVGEVWKKRFPKGNLFFIQAGLQQSKTKLDMMGNVYQLPGAYLSRLNFKEPVRLNGAQIEGRSRFCADVLVKEKPDVFITELFPLGREESRYELAPSLIKSSQQGCSLWAVAGYPLLTALNDTWRKSIIKLYKRIIIFSPPEEKEYIADAFTQKEDRQKYLNFFEQNKDKITFAGYLLPKGEVIHEHKDENIYKPPVPLKALRIAVIRGGGAYYPKLITEAILASDLLGTQYYWTVIAGPSTTPEEWYLFSTLVYKKKVKNLVMYRSVGDYERLIEHSDVCVSVAPYHTSAMLLKHRKKAVVVPFQGLGDMSCREQPARAAMLKDHIGAEILSYDELTAGTLGVMINKAAAAPDKEPKVPSEWFDGANVLDQAFKGFFRH